MLRFGLLKYKKLNNSVSAAELDGLGRAGGDDNGNQSGTTTTTPVRHQQQQQQHPHQMIHNQLNGSLMKNVREKFIFFYVVLFCFCLSLSSFYEGWVLFGESLSWLGDGFVS